MKNRTHSCARSESVLRYHNKRHERCAGRHRLLVRLALQPERQTTQQQLKERDTWPRSQAIQARQRCHPVCHAGSRAPAGQPRLRGDLSAATTPSSLPRCYRARAGQPRLRGDLSAACQAVCKHGCARRRGPPIQASSISTSPRRGGTLNSYGNGHERCTFSP